jgi:hypothetical protein
VRECLQAKLHHILNSSRTNRQAYPKFASKNIKLTILTIIHITSY